ncbi:hypothetical protein PGT21_009313 [Puccinia graminis f. sp. tritici]|uniref:BZIP domain-containing protein n=1 Tax=Puccinia graminis f. sp. tritici TaxID=56615 RepID=A0A5B0Q2B6_PUCGR|nr:hypothetical protein PGT21_009313 [Puccinia graminis f. sp. tritici]KAA1124872.1 hypothetical protein PGTUg99_036242 [Puccinia graminis f. sp. tritici]
MPRQPLVDTPGLPPYGQRSSERRKEQNRIAQRQLRERRQQQEAAQALKLQQQQNEIRRLHRLITELRNENFTLRSQSHTRRRQSVIPISSLSRGLVMSHPHPPTTTPGPMVPTLESACNKPFLARHSIDYSSLHGAGIDTSDSSHRLHEHKFFKSWSSDDQRGPSFASHLRPPGAKSAVLHPAQLAYNHQASRSNTSAELIDQKARPADSLYGQTSSPEMSSVPVESKPPSSNWLSRNTTPPMGDGARDPPTNAWASSPQKLNRSPQLEFASKTENNFFAPSSVNLASFWPAEVFDSPNKHNSHGDVDQFSASTLSVVPSEFFPASNPFMASDRTQPRKTSASTSSDSNSVAPNSDEYSSLSSMSINSAHFPFFSPEILSHHFARSASPTATGSSPEAQVEERNFSDANATNQFRSPFSESNDSEINGQSNFGLSFSWIETEKSNMEALSPLPPHAKPMCLDVSEIWECDL